jgi:dienelactone hydrolase
MEPLHTHHPEDAEPVVKRIGLVVASDIFGVTPQLQELASALAPSYASVRIVDPYAGQQMGFQEESDAYEYFQAGCTISRYADLIAEAVDASGQADLLGFSVGAAAAWSISDRPVARRIRQVTCFYGSRIRDMLHIDPLCPVTLIFPRMEAQFDVEPLIAAVSQKTAVTCVRTPYLHGFMNGRSGNFNQSAYDEFLLRLRGT